MTYWLNRVIGDIVLAKWLIGPGKKMLLKPLKLRTDDGSHRQANWLELFFDLAFVICVATLSHTVLADPSSRSLLYYIALFVPVWWVWNQFTWYASQFDNGDSLFYGFMVAAIGGGIVLADGIHPFLDGHHAWFVGAYLYLHGLLAFGWLRAYRAVGEMRPYSRYKLTGIGLGILLWAGGLCSYGIWRIWLFALGSLLQMGLPMIAWAKVKATISVHHHHLTERHGLFTIIVLGESLVALVNGLHKSGLAAGFPNFILGFAMVVSLWWIYFSWRYNPQSSQSVLRIFSMNYGHLVLYAGLGIFAAGLGLSGDLHNPLTVGFGQALLGLGSGAFLLALSVMSMMSGMSDSSRRNAWQLLMGLGLFALGFFADAIHTRVFLSIIAAILGITAVLSRLPASR